MAFSLIGKTCAVGRAHFAQAGWRSCDDFRFEYGIAADFDEFPRKLSLLYLGQSIEGQVKQPQHCYETINASSAPVRAQIKK